MVREEEDDAEEFSAARPTEEAKSRERNSGTKRRFNNWFNCIEDSIKNLLCITQPAAKKKLRLELYFVYNKN